MLATLCYYFLLVLLYLRHANAQTLRAENPDERFVRLNVNRDSWLSFDEYLHTDEAYEKAKRQEFTSLDQNRDNMIEDHEFLSHFARHQSNPNDPRAQYFGKIFQDFDTNNDLGLSVKEIERILRDNFHLEPRQDLDQIFAFFDKDHSGNLDLFEYINFENGYPVDEIPKDFKPVRVVIRDAQPSKQQPPANGPFAPETEVRVHFRVKTSVQVLGVPFGYRKCKNG
ncbi:unnamed protein product, partial [Mesorhabditis spiculigera]